MKKKNPDAGMNTSDVRTMVIALAHAARSLLLAKRYSDAADAIYVADLYSADADLAAGQRDFI